MSYSGQRRERPAVTWGRLLSWTTANEIPDESIVADEYGNGVWEVRRDDGKVYVTVGDEPKYPVLTWERLKAMGGEIGFQTGDELWFDGHWWADDVKVLDLGGEGGPLDDGRLYLILQRRWG